MKKNDQYMSTAKKLLKSFKGNLNDSGLIWKYCCDIASEWIRLLAEKNPNNCEIERLVKDVNNPPESQGCAYLELKMLINKWSKEI